MIAVIVLILFILIVIDYYTCKNKMSAYNLLC